MPMKTRRWMGRTVAMPVGQAACGAPGLAHAQLRLPSLPSLPSLPAPALPSQAETLNPLRLELPALADTLRSRAQRIGELLRRRGDVIEADPAGQPMLRSEVLLNAPSE